VNDGFIYTVTGKGSYVATSRLDEELQPFSSFTEDMKRRGLVATSKLLEARIVNASAEQAQKMALPKGAELVNLHRLRMTRPDGLPIVIQRAWLPHHKCPGLLSHDLESSSLYAILNSTYHLKLVRAETSIAAALAQPEEGDLLKLIPPAAVLINEQTTYDEHDEIIEFTRSVFRGDRYTLYTKTP
jgi:GntR family transcriptional regulator